jgi:uncharacterized protein (DUF1800 family)
MPLYQCQPPTGYKDTADAWVSTGGLVARMNFATRLAGGTLGAIALDVESAAGSADAAIGSFLGNDASDATRATIARATNAPTITALTLGSPEFQRR